MSNSFVFGFTNLRGRAIVNATPYTFEMGPDSYVDTSGTSDPGLVMYANLNPNLDNIWYELEVGESSDLYFATIGTFEEWVNSDDENPGNLTAGVDFDNPELTQSIGGTSIGFIGGFFGFYQGWSIVWNDPVSVSFGSGGQFTVELTDVTHETNWWLGPEGEADVYATVTYDSAPVPEPSTVMLLGAGLLGLVAVGHRRFLKKK